MSQPNINKVIDEDFHSKLLTLDFSTLEGATESREAVFRYTSKRWRDDLFNPETCEEEILRFENSQRDAGVILDETPGVYYIASRPILNEADPDSLSGNRVTKMEDSHFPIWLIHPPDPLADPLANHSPHLLSPTERLKGLDRVPPGLSRVFDLARNFPPALAIARECANEWQSGTQQQVLVAYSYIVLKYLNRSTRYLKAKSLAKTTSSRSNGEFYWIIASDLDRVHWVSADYFIYHDSAESFDLNTADLVSLPNQIPSEPLYQIRFGNNPGEQASGGFSVPPA